MDKPTTEELAQSLENVAGKNESIYGRTRLLDDAAARLRELKADFQSASLEANKAYRRIAELQRRLDSAPDLESMRLEVIDDSCALYLSWYNTDGPGRYE